MQELTVSDFKIAYNPNLNKEKFLIVYNFMKESSKTLRELYYYDDNFYWSESFIVKKYKESMVSGKELYDTIYICRNVYFDFYEVKSYIKEGAKSFTMNFKDNPLGNNDKSGQYQRYVEWILNRLRPTEECIKLVEEKQKELMKEHSLEQENFEKKKKEFEEACNNKDMKRAKEILNENITLTSGKNKGYIYGIKIDNELVYIGKTIRPLKERISEHIECMLNKNIKNSQQNYLYKAMRECNGYKFEVIKEFSNINNYDLELKEKQLIEEFRPKYNYEGVKVDYRFSSEAEKDALNKLNEVILKINNNEISVIKGLSLLGAGS